MIASQKKSRYSMPVRVLALVLSFMMLSSILVLIAIILQMR